MTAATQTLTDFLLARIAEDEVDLHLKAGRPDRIDAECEAKRRIVTLMGYVRESWDNTRSGEGRVMWPDVTRREKSHALMILETLAAIYGDHPDYREEWRP
jgi:hypothetical protein